jgi:hypothetical protein
MEEHDFSAQETLEQIQETFHITFVLMDVKDERCPRNVLLMSIRDLLLNREGERREQGTS